MRIVLALLALVAGIYRRWAMAGRKVVFAVTLLLAALFETRPARACAACGCGDPTLTALGVEKPYRNRIRVGIEERLASLSVGDSAQGEKSIVLRSALIASWMPHVRIQVGVLLPWFDSWITPTGGRAKQQINGLGDLELSGRVLIFRERSFSPRHLLWLTAGLKMPTGPRLRDGAGYPYSDDDQPGSGSWDPFWGVTYAWFSGGITSMFASTSYRYTTTGRIRFTAQRSTVSEHRRHRSLHIAGVARQPANGPLGSRRDPGARGSGFKWHSIGRNQSRPFVGI